MIFFNSAATTAVKPRAVIDVISSFYKTSGSFNSNRGSGFSSGGEDLSTECRTLLARIFNIPRPERIAFCYSATHAINLALFGILKPGDHVITTIYEHNSVLRPLSALKKTRDISLDIIGAKNNQLLDLESLENHIKKNTVMIIANHSSNVTGDILPIKEIGDIAAKHNIIFMLDASQSAGLLNIDVVKNNIGLLAFTGHKSLYGPMGTGGLYFAPGLDPEPLIYGGTGTFSESFAQPDILPDKYEAGTLNLIGLAGLTEGVKFVLQTGSDKLYEHGKALRALFIDNVKQLQGVRLIGVHDERLTTPVVSITADGMNSNEMGEILEKSFDIIVRPGLHCAPLMHKHLKTFESGTVRFSFCYFNTQEEVIEGVEALRIILKKHPGGIQ
jgi:cysteine desulfurase/selenocysteine lyase